MTKGLKFCHNAEFEQKELISNLQTAWFTQLDRTRSPCTDAGQRNATPENTHLLCKGKYHCTADLLFDQLGFLQTSKSVYSFNSTKQLNPNQSNRRSAVQWYFPLRSKWVFSGQKTQLMRPVLKDLDGLLVLNHLIFCRNLWINKPWRTKQS